MFLWRNGNKHEYYGVDFTHKALSSGSTQLLEYFLFNKKCVGNYFYIARHIKSPQCGFVGEIKHPVKILFQNIGSSGLFQTVGKTIGLGVKIEV